MAVVLPSKERDLFPQTLQRTHSQSNFMSTSSQGLHKSSSTSRIDQLFQDNRQRLRIPSVPDPSPDSSPCSADTAPVESEIDHSYASTPATNFSLDGNYENEGSGYSQDSLLLSEHADNPYFMFDDSEDFEPTLRPSSENAFPDSPMEDTPPSVTLPVTPFVPEHAEDDTAVEHHPTQHVDYLSHDWREEDIWSSWRYITTRRREFVNAPRLENASWRTWMKAKFRLKTVSPETLNWLKDCDVTWLYGPLQTRETTMLDNNADRTDSNLSRSDSFIHKKPILKKRSMSEIMLQRSISSSSLLKQAAAAVQAQQKDGGTRIPRPILYRAHTDLVTFPFSERRRSRANTSLFPSTANSGIASPTTEKKHIHFDEQVKQCIAVDVKGDEEEEEEEETDPYSWNYEDSDSDDGAIMMKSTKTSKRPIYLRKKAPSSTTNESKTIAMLPSTTLKYRPDSPAPDSAMKHSTDRRNSTSTLSSSSSQETLRPSKASGAFFCGSEDEDDDDDDDDDEDDSASAFPTEPTRSSVVGDQHLRPDLRRTASVTSLEEKPAGMRRTESGMFMPYEEGPLQPNDGLIGRVIDTVNTARDIAHVIWNRRSGPGLILGASSPNTWGLGEKDAPPIEGREGITFRNGLALTGIYGGTIALLKAFGTEAGIDDFHFTML
ncbi:hypothetical protein GGS20DRAFT_581545 [Poronia punctata]|nr:hypothetical protein GGS20DRAFT_581545 [Poronia punctata]